MRTWCDCFLRLSCFFSSAQDGLDVEIDELSVRVVYSSFELSDAPSGLTGIRLHLRLDAGELWIGDLHVARPFRLQGVGRLLVQATEIVASETRMDVLNLFPLRSSGPFWARLGYVPHGITARVLSKPCGGCSSIPSFENVPSPDSSSSMHATQRHLL